MSSLSQLADILHAADFSCATEAIDFQTDPKFATSIRDVFQKIIAFRESCRGDKRIVRKTIDFAKQTMTTEFTKLWKDHLGITLSKITFSENISFLFAMKPNMGSQVEMGKMIDSMTGNNLYSQNIDFSNKTYEEIRKVAASFSKKDGSVGLKKYMEKDINMEFFFDPFVGFLSKDTINVNLEYFTAEELTAITLHEVGHMMSLIEHCADIFFRVGMNAAIIKSFVNTAPLSEKINMAKEILKDPVSATQTIASGSGLSANEADAATKVAKNMADSFKDHVNDNQNDSATSFWKTILNFFIQYFCIAYLVILAIYAPIRLFILALFVNLLSSFSRDYVQKGGLNQPKYSDFLANKTNAFNWERWADEYVTRHGYGSALANGLNKLFYISERSSLFSSDNGKGTDMWIRNSWVPLYLNYIVSCYSSLILGGNMDDGFGIYESQMDRIRRIIQDTTVVFKQQDLSAEVMDVYLQEFEKCQASLNNIGMTRRCEHLFALIHRCIMSFVDPVQLGNRLFRGNIKAEYAELANQIDDLKNNSLFYQAARLNSIISKKG